LLCRTNVDFTAARSRTRTTKPRHAIYKKLLRIRHIIVAHQALTVDQTIEWPEPVTVYGLNQGGPLVIETQGAMLWAVSDIGI